MRKYSIALFVVFLGGCASSWQMKPGDTQQGLARDEHECAQKNDRLYDYDLFLFNSCMEAKGWRHK